MIAFLAEACKRGCLRSNRSREELFDMFATRYKRRWNVFIGRRDQRRSGSSTMAGMYDDPRSLSTASRGSVIARLNTWPRNKQFVPKRYKNEEFVDTLIQHVPARGRHAMRYYGLLSRRSKARLWAAIFVLLNQQQHPHPPRTSWRWLRRKTFGIDPLQDACGRSMHCVGRRPPVRSGLT